MTRRAIAIVVAATVVAALAGVLVARRNSGNHAPPRLPIAVSTGRTTAAGEADAALAPYGALTYHAGAGLRSLDGAGRAYHVSNVDGEGAARRIAAALGLRGEPTAQGDGFVVNDDSGQLIVTPRDWSYSSGAGGSVSSSGVATACPPDAPKCIPGPGVPTPTRPADLPSEDAAKTAAIGLLQRVGMDMTSAAVDADDGVSQWFVRVDPKVDGLATEGFGASVVVGEKGAIVSASGVLGAVAAADEYPLVGTAAAIDRLNSGFGLGGPERLSAAGAAADAVASTDAIGTASATAVPGSVGPDQPPAAPIPVEPAPPEPASPAPASPAPASPVPAPGEPPGSEPPLQPPPPQDVTLTGADRILLYVSSTNGSDGWLVPAYRFSTADGPGPTVLAVDDRFLTAAAAVEPIPPQNPTNVPTEGGR